MFDSIEMIRFEQKYLVLFNLLKDHIMIQLQCRVDKEQAKVSKRELEVLKYIYSY